MITRGIEALHERLVEYIEATYHIADPFLLAQRAELLRSPGTVRQAAYIESTKAYKTGLRFDDLLRRFPEKARRAAGNLLEVLAKQDPPLVYDPPYAHQWESAETLLTGGGGQPDSVVVFTGTGSGKTECFTTPIMLRLLAEASSAPESFKHRAIRALILYPMNALVNDQLGRIRLSLGSDPVAKAFTEVGGRPATFGQYTGRTPFAGLRSFDSKGDGAKMKAFKDFYMDTVLGPATKGNGAALRLWEVLKSRGRWPSKPELNEWFGGREYGATSTLWRDRLHPRPSDRELLARHEFYGYRVEPGEPLLGAPPDVLVTNYSMLEYMLMRPVERRIFDQTRDWLAANPEETFFLVLDEAHLYRGAQGTEVALLVRRLLERLGLSGAASKRVRVAVTSASFSSAERAASFASQLVGFPPMRFRSIGGVLDIPSGGEPADAATAKAFAQVSLPKFYGAENVAGRAQELAPLLAVLGVDPKTKDWGEPLEIERTLYEALKDLPVRRRVVARTQMEAFRIEDLAADLFPTLEPLEGAAATEALVALCAFARKKADGSNLLPSRIHSFHRGLPGLWLCVNPQCVGVPPESRGGIGGAMFAQPHEKCPHCAGRVFEFFTCRSCGAAYARGYTSEWAEPTFIWQVRGGEQRDDDRPLPIDLLLEPGRGDRDLYEVKDFSIRTGVVVGPAGSVAEGTRPVGLYRLGEEGGETPEDDGRVFYRCGVCADDNNREERINGKPVTLHRSPVEDHQTAGQEPFYALAHEQLVRQNARSEKPAHLESETPQRGRKLLVFSDGRQKAARLAAEMGRASLRDAVRPLLLRGFEHLQKAGHPQPLSFAYGALLIGARISDVQVRSTDDRFDAEIVKHLGLAQEVLENDLDISGLGDMAALTAPPPAATALLRVLRDKHTGLQALALAGLEPFGMIAKKAFKAIVEISLPGTDEPTRRALGNLWLGVVLEQHGSDLFTRDQLEPKLAWLAGRKQGGLPRPFAKAVKGALGVEAAQVFKDAWLPKLRDAFYEDKDDRGSLRSSRVALALPPQLGDLGGWHRCPRCSKVQVALLAPGACVRCGLVGTLSPIVDGVGKDQFLARKRFYRRAVTEGTRELSQPLVAREHSAQLTGASGDAHTRAERYELAFQDITEPSVDGMRVPIDVLSCTTTMEVGIDIGSLSGVALRNMPPGRANYQQRAGRAGRLGSGVATVMAYADQDGHNQHFFENPQKLVKATVPDPFLNLANRWITRRHVNAFVLQRYLAERVPLDAAPTPAHANLFGALGPVAAFIGGGGEIGLEDFEAWISGPGVGAGLKAALERWIPPEVDGRAELIDGVQVDVPASIRAALPEAGASNADAGAGAGATAEGAGADVDDEEEASVEDKDTSRRDRLLDRLLYEGVLPKYAFPTDLVAFTVFESTNGLDAPKELRDKVRYAPQRNLALALSEYAPGKVVFIDGRAWRSGALVSPVPGGLEEALAQALFMRVCARCQHTDLFLSPEESEGSNCPACGDPSFGSGPGQRWIRPPGFGHPVTRRPQPDADFGETARAGRAVLAAPSPKDGWKGHGSGLESRLGKADSNELIVTNAGPRDAGFRLCTSCGAIEPAVSNQLANNQGHYKPVPNRLGKNEQCESPDYEIVRLGTRFRTDVLLVRLRLPSPQRLELGAPAFGVTMASLTEALTLATCKVLEIEAGEVLGGYRRGFSQEGPEPDALEVFLYDQLAGGAGYVVEAQARLDEIFAEARRILTHDGAGGVPCDRACYGCLLSFKNSFEHHLYDRRLALDLIDSVRNQTPATLNPQQQGTAYDLLREWLSLVKLGEVLKDEPVAQGDGAPVAPILLKKGERRIVPALAHPFAPSIPCDAGLAEAMQMGAGLGVEIVPLDYLDVIRALPRATRQFQEVTGG